MMEAQRKLKLKKRSRSRSSSQENGSRKGQGESITKHYPWMLQFDTETKTMLVQIDMDNVDVYRLVTLLESNVSPEVTRLKNKPNRATKFLCQVKRRTCLAKMGGYMMNRDLELRLFPIYGLLMTHFVNITLTSSQVEKCGAQQVAKDLYRFLKLMFEEGNEYILDVVLCSTLDEHAASKDKVGYQLFSFIVQDWRYFSETHSSLMKYYAVAALLSEASSDGKVFVEGTAPSEVDKEFPKFLIQKLNMEFEGVPKKKIPTSKAVLQAIKVARVKSISRGRLVIVSKAKLSQNIRSESTEDDNDSDPESTCSTLINIPLGRRPHQSPSSSCTKSERLNVDEFLATLGCFVDTSGAQEGGTLNPNPYSYDRGFEDVEDYLGSGERHVSSSTVADEGSLLQIKIEPGDDYSDNDMEIEEADIVKRKSTETGTRNSSYFEEDEEADEDDKTVSINQSAEKFPGSTDKIEDDDLHAEDSEQYQESLVYEPCSDDERGRIMSDVDDDYYDDVNDLLSQKSVADNIIKPIAAPDEHLTADNEDSDLEILSEKALSKASSDSGSDLDSNERDEAEPESGEDYVPNYDVDSEEEQGDDDVESEKESEGTEVELKNKENDKKPIDKVDKDSMDTSSATGNEELPPSSLEIELEGQDQPTNSAAVESAQRDHPQEENELDEQETDRSQRNGEEDRIKEQSKGSPKRSPMTPLRKSTRGGGGTGAGVEKSPTSKTDNESKVSSNGGTRPKRMKLISKTNDADNDADSDNNEEDENEDTFSDVSKLSQRSSSRRGRGSRAGRTSGTGAQLRAELQTLGPVEASPSTGTRTRRSTRLAATPQPPPFTSTPTVAGSAARNRRSVAKGSTSATLETETKTKNPPTATKNPTPGRGKGRARPSSKK